MFTMCDAVIYNCERPEREQWTNALPFPVPFGLFGVIFLRDLECQADARWVVFFAGNRLCALNKSCQQFAVRYEHPACETSPYVNIIKTLHLPSSAV